MDHPTSKTDERQIGSLLIYPSVLAMAGCDVARRVRASSLRVVAGVDSRRSLRDARFQAMIDTGSEEVGFDGTYPGSGAKRSQLTASRLYISRSGGL